MAYMDAQLGVIAIGSTYSAASVNQFLNELLRLQDVGYLQLSTATGLSMMLVFGASSFMASTYQRDLTGEQHYDPKKNAPDTLSRAPQTAFQPQWSHTEAGGRIGTGSREAFAGATFNIDTRRTSGVSFSQLESFARDGSTTLSTNVGHSEQALNTTSFGTDTTTTGRETVSSSNGADILHTVAAGMVGSIGDANTKNDSYSQANQLGVASQVGASAGAGVGAGGNGGGAPGAGVSAGATANANITMTHLQSEGNQRSTVATDDVSSRVVKSDSSKVSVGEEISNASSERSGEQSLKSESAQTSEDLRVQTGETRGSSQSESQTASEMTTKTTSTPYDAILAANQIARDDTLYSWLSQTVANNGELNSAVNNFMDRHSTKLDHTFHPNDDKARFAFAASYVMQGLEANDLFSSDADGGVARRAAINAMSDEIILSTGYGNVGEGKTPSIEDLRKRDAPKPEDIPAMMGSRFKGYELTKGAVDEQIGKLPNTGDSGQIYQSFLSGLGVDGGSLAKENGNAILSHMRAKIDRENGPIVENEQGLLQVYREAGTVAAIQNLLWKDNESVRKEAVLDTYDNSLRNGSSQIGISTSIAQRVITGVSPEHDPNNAQELGATMLDNRMRELYGKGMASKDDNGVAKYMTLAQFEAGANETGNQALSEFFSKERANMAKQDEVFANPEVASRITTLSMLGTSPESMGGNIVRAQQEYMLGSMERHLENDIGQDLSTDGSNVRWGLLPSRRMGGRGADTDGGRSTYPTGSPEDRLLSLIGSVEAPDGYDTFEYASHRNPPPMPLTSMTIGEVKQWQDQRIMGAETRAAGQYQMTGGSDPKRTFAKTTAALGLSDDQLFSAEVQDSMGMYLAKQSGFNDFMRGDLQTEDFGLQLSKVWAAFPNITGSNPDNSYYEGLQGNKAQIGADFMTAFLRDLNPRNQ